MYLFCTTLVGNRNSIIDLVEIEFIYIRNGTDIRDMKVKKKKKILQCTLENRQGLTRLNTVARSGQVPYDTLVYKYMVK